MDIKVNTTGIVIQKSYLIETFIKKEIFVTVYFSLFIKDNIVDNFEIFIHSFNNLKWFSTIIKIPKLYEVEEVDGMIKITITDIVKFDFFYYNRSIYKSIIEAVYILEMFINFISIRKF